MISVKLEPIDDPSTITGDTSASTEEDNSISGDLDATDIEGLTNNTPFSIADDPSNGSASIDAATGAWTYTPNADFNGSDSFIISITDDLGGTTKQAINISVGIVNDPSTISGNTAANTKEDNTVSGDLDATDTEGLTNNTPFSIANDPSNGSASIDAATGSWTYTPNADFNGSDSFIVSITDDLSGTTTQAITINVEPVDDPSSITGDTTASTKEDNSISGDLDATDTEGLTNNIPFSIANDPSNGSAFIDAATGAWTYTPNADFNGSDSFIVSITDDLGGTTTQAITINVEPVDDPSSIIGDTTANTKEDNSVSGDLDATDTEGLTNNTPFSIANDPSNGSASINPATGAWTYTPDADFNGSDSFIVSITDDLGDATTQAITITVDPVDDPSTITGDTSVNTDEDNSVSGDLDATDTEGLTNNTPFSVANDPSNGSASIDAATGSWTYTPNANFNGSDSFIVSITDDLGGTTKQAINISVGIVNDPSTISGNTAANTKEDNSVTGDLDASDTEGLTNNTPFSIANDPSNGSASIDAATGSWTYTPNADFNGSDSFIVSITDDLGGTTKQAINISITQVNDVPSGELNFTGSTALNDTLNLNSTITDVDGVDPELIRYGLDRKAAWSNTWESLSDPWSPTVHVLKPIDLGMRLRISASYTDGGGTAERVNSAPLLIPYPEPSLHGSSADEQLIGSDRDDTITAAAGADSLLAFGGDDHLDGGSGWDTLYLRGPRADYALHKLQEDLLRLSDSIHQRDGTDLITGIEQLQFTDELLPISAVIDELPLATTDAWKADLDGDQLFSPISDGIAIASHFLPASGANLSSRAELALGINSGYLDFNQDKLLQRNEAELLLRFGFGTFPGSHLSEGLEIATSPDQLALQLAALL
ncbi:MAG: tandem-95 repeat protein [Synechococcus sp. BS307-5m-G34]|nr:tandem-95 repeat protein [Synechococcus sp. BS307-5m-G34]